MNIDDLKLFQLNGQLAMSDLDQVESRFGCELGHRTESEEVQLEGYYDQFDELLRAQAREMARHYELFYCVENFIRDTVCARLREVASESWWDEIVPQEVQDNAAKNRSKEEEAAITPRSDDMIDYTTFGELAKVIEANWDEFGDVFSNKKALVRVLRRLELAESTDCTLQPIGGRRGITPRARHQGSLSTHGLGDLGAAQRSVRIPVDPLDDRLAARLRRGLQGAGLLSPSALPARPVAESARRTGLRSCRA